MIKKWLLKSFFILWLILLPISFSSAFNYKTWNTTTSWRINSINDSFSFSPYNSDYMFMVERLWWLKTVYGLIKKNILYLNNNFIFFWDNWNPYFYLSNNRQWVPAKFVLCDSFWIGELPQSCSRSLISDYSSSFFNSLTSSDRYFVSYEQQRWVPGYPSCNSDYEETYTVCFSSSLKSQSVCFYVANYNPWVTCNVSVWLSEGREITTLQGSLWLDNPTYNTINGGDSPWAVVVPDYSVWSWRQLRNYEVLMWFEYMWLSKEYCYWWFDIDNIFLPSEQFSDFSGYSFWNGASIFDLYNSYWWGLSMKSFLSNYYQSFLNAQLSNFHNKSKALLMLFQQYQSANDREWGSFKLNDLMDYCDLYFNLKNNNRENDWDIYTWNNQSAINSYQLNRKIPEGGFTNTWVLVNWSWFSSADEFFWRLTNLFQSSVDWVEGTFPPMIPSYIVAFMLAIILIRIISH